MPCKILRLIKTNGPNILQGLASAESYEERFRVLMDLLETFGGFSANVEV